MQPVLRIHNLHKSFLTRFITLGNRSMNEVTEVLKGIDMEIERGSATAILGANGSGKSTLFNIISGLVRPDKGQIEYNYQDKTLYLSTMPSYKQAAVGIARLFQGSNVFPNLSVLDNMRIADNNRIGEQPWHFINKPGTFSRAEAKRTDKARGILSLFSGMKETLWEKKDKHAGSLSLGQQRLLSFARLFMNEKAELFLLDEPSAGVNTTIQEQMIEMIRNLRLQGKTILMIEHNLPFAGQCVQDGYYLQDGQLVLKGKIGDLMKKPLIVENYFGYHAGN